MFQKIVKSLLSLTLLVLGTEIAVICIQAMSADASAENARTTYLIYIALSLAVAIVSLISLIRIFIKK